MPTGGLRGAFDFIDKARLASYQNLVWILKGTEEANPIKDMMVVLTAALFM
jgi:hypothetical protein